MIIHIWLNIWGRGVNRDCSLILIPSAKLMLHKSFEQHSFCSVAADPQQTGPTKKPKKPCIFENALIDVRVLTLSNSYCSCLGCSIGAGPSNHNNCQQMSLQERLQSVGGLNSPDVGRGTAAQCSNSNSCMEELVREVCFFHDFDMLSSESICSHEWILFTVVVDKNPEIDDNCYFLALQSIFIQRVLVCVSNT